MGYFLIGKWLFDVAADLISLFILTQKDFSTWNFAQSKEQILVCL